MEHVFFYTLIAAIIGGGISSIITICFFRSMQGLGIFRSPKKYNGLFLENYVLRNGIVVIKLSNRGHKQVCMASFDLKVKSQANELLDEHQIFLDKPVPAGDSIETVLKPTNKNGEELKINGHVELLLNAAYC